MCRQFGIQVVAPKQFLRHIETIAMTTISLRLPDSLHKAVRELVEQEGGSINHFVTLALAEKLAALQTETYLRERAQQGNVTKFRAALAKVADVPAVEEDQL